MAKLKKRSKLSQQRHRANKLVNPTAFSGENKPIDAQIKDIFVSLNSQDNDTRLKAISSLTLLCDADATIRKLALKNNLIKLLMTNYVLDKEPSIRSCSLGLLRNLVIEEEYDMAIHLWRNDIWLVLENGFKSIEVTGFDVEYLDALIGLLDSICLELTSSIVDDSIIPKLSAIMKLFFEVLNKFSLGELTEVKPVVSILQFLFDLSSISTKFLQTLSTDFNFIQASGPLFSRLGEGGELAKIYMIGINFQICEFNEDLGNGQVDQVIMEIFNIINSIDVNGTIAKLNSNVSEDTRTKENFQIIDTSLDLFSTMIEFTGYLMDTKGVKSNKFSGLLNDKIIPFLNQLVCNGFKNDKLLICLNNSLVYLTSTKTGGDEGIKEMFVSMNSILSSDLATTITNFNNEDVANVEHISDLISFKLDLIEYINDPAEKQALIQSDSENVENLIHLSASKLLNFENEDLNNDIVVQYSTILIQYLTIIGKRCANDTTTQTITKFIVDQLLIRAVSYYNAKQTPTNGKKLTVAKYHSKYGYIIENVLNEAINSIIEMFDDNYSYNVDIYHKGGLDKVLTDLLPEYKLIYKNIDKNSQFGLKKRSEDTLMNLGRFVIYKSTELN